MAFVDDDLAVVADGFAHLAVADEALNHGDVQRPHWAGLAAADSPDLRGIDTQKQGELVHPLLEQRATVNQDESIDPARRHQVGAHHRLSRAGRRHQHAQVVRQHGLHRSLLLGA